MNNDFTSEEKKKIAKQHALFQAAMKTGILPDGISRHQLHSYIIDNVEVSREQREWSHLQYAARINELDDDDEAKR